MNINTLTISSAAEALNSNNISSVELCSIYLQRCDELEPKLKAFLHLNKGNILKQAEEADIRRKEGKPRSDFDGVPIAVKDNIAVKGEPCTCASKILENFISPYDAYVIRRLKEKGFILFGRTNLDEFAMGSTCENSAFQKTANPWDFSRVPGGSSGGSAAATAAREVTAALGSDTGGSIRQPAAFCGTVGLKPTYGRISRYGLVAFASSLDQIGPITNDVLDAAILLDTIAGKDDKDSTSLTGEKENFADACMNPDFDFSQITFGYPVECFQTEGLSDSVKNAFEKTKELLKSLGARIKEINMPHSKYAVAVYYIIATAEASANLARFDGIRYGFRDNSAKDAIDIYFKSRGIGFGDEVKRRIILGTYVLSSGYYDAYYLRAQKLRTLIRTDYDNVFKECDFILMPVTPSPAYKFGEKSTPLQMYLSDIFTISLNLAGHCGLSMPVDIDNETGMPVSVQLVSPAMQEGRLLGAAKIIEDNREIKSFIPSCIK